MLKKYINILSIIFTLLLSPMYAHAQIYIEGNGGVNTLTLLNGYNFTGNVGFGYNDRKIKIGIEAGIGTGIGYKKSGDTPSGGGGGISFTDYTEGGNYGAPRKTISYSGNINPDIKNNIIFANQFSFGVNSEWFIIKTFTDKLDWFDIGLFSGIGFSHHHASDTSIFQPYIKAGLEFNFNVAKNVTFLLNGDVRYFPALKGIDNQTNAYHSYVQQTINVGIRYTIPIIVYKKHKEETPDIKPSRENLDVNNLITVNVYNTSTEGIKEVVKYDTVIIKKMVPLPLTILFANDRYDIRKTEFEKLELAINYMKEYGLNARIIGMASNIGGHNYNQLLSLQRCQTVRDYLIDNGIETKRITINALGDTNSEFKEEELDRCVIIIFE